MNWIIFHIASGEAFFTGAVMAVAGVCARFSTRSWIRWCSSLVFLIGLLLIGVSATPFPYWFYTVAGLISAGWLVIGESENSPKRRKRIAAGLTVAVWLLAAGWELTCHITPSVESADSEPIVIFADSLTAGIGENEAETWPHLLKRTQGATIHDFSRIGATVSSVLHKVQQIDVPEGIVILEIGGNDILGTTSVERFAATLDECLTLLRKTNPRIIMFELPLPPFCNSYGLVQRRLARKHGVTLIPKRVLMGVLARRGATLDSIHLTQSGHDTLAKTVWRILGREWRE